MLWNDEKIKPKLSFASETPIKSTKLQPLVDSTIVTNGNYARS